MTKGVGAEQLLQEGLNALSLSVDCEPLMAYLALLSKWNKAFNLTAIRNLPDMVTHHVLDSLAIAEWLQGPNSLDVGSGAGLPGIPLALAHPDCHFTLLDSNGKKTRFLEEVKRVLKLDNVTVVQARAESWCPEKTFDTITNRALTHLSQMISWTKHLIAPSGRWLAMKGKCPIDELSTVTLPYEVKTFAVPHLEGERCCIIIKNLA